MRSKKISGYHRKGKVPFSYSSMPTVHVVGECELGTAVGRANDVRVARDLMHSDRIRRRLGMLLNTSVKSWSK